MYLLLVKMVEPWKHDSDAWKRVLIELFQALILNGSRGKASLKLNGDVETSFAIFRVVAMETEKYGLGSVEIGCVMACNLHTNNCHASMTSHQGGSVCFLMTSHLVKSTSELLFT